MSWHATKRAGAEEMAQVTVTIAGRAYRMACGDGEEPHLEALAAMYDGHIEQLRASVGEIGDMRLHVMAAIMVADELAESRKRIAMLEARLESASGDAGSADARAEEVEARSAEAITRATERLERLARVLKGTVAEV
jgi:cell division protein ZapA